MHLIPGLASGRYPELILSKAGLLERDVELREIASAIGDALEGRGRLVIVEGAAGAGKSAVLGAARESAAETGLRVLEARGTELEREFAFGAIRRIFEPVLVAASETERTKLLAGAAAPAEWVIDPSAEGDDPHTRSAAGFAALHGIYWLAANVAADGPLVLSVDDLHWVDASSLRALGYLAQRIADLPIVILLALRPAEPGAPAALLDALRGQPGTTTLSPGPLGSGAVSELVRARIPDADDEVCVACLEQSAGNPLYLEELLRAVSPDGGVTAAAVREASVPSLAERVARRTVHVDPRAPALTGAMAVLGDGGRLAMAASLTGMAEDDAAGIAQRLRRIEVLSAEDPFAFVHPLVRRSAYDQLSVTERDAVHTAAAQALTDEGASAEEVATHLASVRPAKSIATAAGLMAAADQALGRAAPDAAIGWLERALEERAPEPEPAEILLELGMVGVAGRDLAAVEHLREALGLAGSAALRARVSVALAEILVHSGQWEAGRDVMAEAVAGLDQEDADTVLEVLGYWSVVTFYDPSLGGEFDRLKGRFEELSAGEAWPAYALRAMLALAKGLRGEPRDEVVAQAAYALEGDRLMGERAAGAWASPQALTALVAVDEFELALKACETLAEQSRLSGSFMGTTGSLGFRGWIFAKRGDLAAAEAEIRIAWDLVNQAGMPLLITSAMYFLVDAVLERPSLDDVAELVHGLGLEQAFLASWGGAMLFEVRGRLRLMQGDRRGAVADLREVTEVARTLSVGPTFSPCRSALALALGPEDRAEATELIAEELELARASGLPRPEGIALRAAGLLAGGEDGIAQLRASLSVLERSEAALERARTQVELGAALRRAGQRAEARGPLTEGMDLAHRCGAPRLVERARDELRATGARPRRVVHTGVDALTASELRVVRLAASGRSNPEIAQELYVSIKTVETHLSRAYSKLGLAGQGARAGLAELLSPGA